jgi:hypothetical protein
MEFMIIHTASNVSYSSDTTYRMVQFIAFSVRFPFVLCAELSSFVMRVTFVRRRIIDNFAPVRGNVTVVMTFVWRYRIVTDD